MRSLRSRDLAVFAIAQSGRLTLKLVPSGTPLKDRAVRGNRCCSLSFLTARPAQNWYDFAYNGYFFKYDDFDLTFFVSHFIIIFFPLLFFDHVLSSECITLLDVHNHSGDEPRGITSVGNAREEREKKGLNSDFWLMILYTCIIYYSTFDVKLYFYTGWISNYPIFSELWEKAMHC